MSQLSSFDDFLTYLSPAKHDDAARLLLGDGVDGLVLIADAVLDSPTYGVLVPEAYGPKCAATCLDTVIAVTGQTTNSLLWYAKPVRPEPREYVPRRRNA